MAELLERRLSIRNLPGVRDVVVLLVEVEGERAGRRRVLTYRLVHRYDEAEGLTAMAKTTAYTASIVARLLLEGEIRRKGVVPPELLGMDEAVYRQIIEGLRADGIEVEGAM